MNASPMTSSITYLSVSSPSKVLNRSHEKSSRGLTDQSRNPHVNRVRNKKNAQVIVANAAGVARERALALFKSVSRLLRAQLKARHTGVARYASSVLHRVFGGLGDLAAFIRVRALGRSVQRMLKRLRTLRTVRLVPILKQPTQKRRRLLITFVYVAAILVVTARKIRRNQRVRELVPYVAATFATRVIESQKAVAVTRTVEQRDLVDRKVHTKKIERAWSEWRELRKDRSYRKRKLLLLLSSGLGCLQSNQDQQLSTNFIVSVVSSGVIQTVLNELSRRRAAALIQRVWRGRRARGRVGILIALRARRACVNVQRGRVSRAREALLLKESSDQTSVARRVAARRRNSLVRMVPCLRVSPEHRCHSALKALPCRTPPRQSVFTGAKIIPVSIFKYQRMVIHRKRVNSSNVWVAIPVRYQNATKSCSFNHKSHVLSTAYDWIPSSLLVPKQSTTA